MELQRKWFVAKLLLTHSLKERCRVCFGFLFSPHRRDAQVYLQSTQKFWQADIVQMEPDLPEPREIRARGFAACQDGSGRYAAEGSRIIKVTQLIASQQAKPYQGGGCFITQNSAI